jgi:hypothetical protein
MFKVKLLFSPSSETAPFSKFWTSINHSLKLDAEKPFKFPLSGPGTREKVSLRRINLEGNTHV